MEMNAFKRIEGDETLSPAVKKEMVSNLHLAKLIGDFIDLFGVKSFGTMSQSLASGGDTNPSIGNRKSDISND